MKNIQCIKILLLLGVQVQRPPPPAKTAAQLVSSVLTTNVPQSTKSTQDGKNDDSSTDTEDSDDSEGEHQVVNFVCTRKAG